MSPDVSGAFAFIVLWSVSVWIVVLALEMLDDSGGSHMSRSFMSPNIMWAAANGSLVSIVR